MVQWKIRPGTLSANAFDVPDLTVARISQRCEHRELRRGSALGRPQHLFREVSLWWMLNKGNNLWKVERMVSWVYL